MIGALVRLQAEAGEALGRDALAPPGILALQAFPHAQGLSWLATLHDVAASDERMIRPRVQSARSKLDRATAAREH